MWIYVFFAAALLGVGTFAADKTSTVGNITTKVLGQSGKIMVYRGDDQNDGVTITFSGLSEIDEGDAKINSHTFNNFAQLTFTFSDLENTTYPDSNVTVTKFTFDATISIDTNDAKLVSDVFMFTEDGNITVDGENVEIKKGNMKFNVKVESWPFCNTCTHGSKQLTGKYLDFEVEMKGASMPNETSPGVYDFGGAQVLVPKEVIYDGSATAKDMPTGYPKLATVGAKSIFTFRFEKFNTSAFYDPNVDLGDDGGDGGDGGETTTPAAENAETLTDSDIEIKVMGQSGKISMMQSGSTTGDALKNKITIEFDNLQEKDSNGDVINDNAHKLQTFANQDFTFNTLADDNYPDTELDCKRITFESTLHNSAKLMIYMYLFKEAGDITNDNETISVKEGTMKFNVRIENWQFCTSSCPKNAIGEYLDFEIVVKGSGKAKKDTSKDTETYELGNAMATLSKKIVVDGTNVEMVADYPMLATQGSKDIFKFRFPKFSSNVMYDPTFTMNSAGNGGSAVKVSLATLMVVVMSLILKTLF